MASHVPIIDPVSENIFFDIMLKATYWNNPPELEVVIDNECIEKYIINQPEFHIRFRRVMLFDQPHTLELRRAGKTNDQSQTLPNGSIETQMLEIKNIKLDNVDLRNLILSRSTFEPEYPEPWASEQLASGINLEKEILGEMYLGHNGVWRFRFTSPIYKFLVTWTTQGL
jgi:hypothetical protein